MSQISSSVDLGALPEGWKVKVSRSQPGRLYYVNEITRVTSWEPPQMVNAPQLANSPSLSQLTPSPNLTVSPATKPLNLDNLESQQENENQNNFPKPIPDNSIDNSEQSVSEIKVDSDQLLQEKFYPRVRESPLRDLSPLSIVKSPANSYSPHQSHVSLHNISSDKSSGEVNEHLFFSKAVILRILLLLSLLLNVLLLLAVVKVFSVSA